MNEARREAYQNLIESILTCPTEEENKVLQNNSELVHAGLMQAKPLEREKKCEKSNENAT
ncbi:MULTISPECIES: hypothetical protein [unclassified Microcoleus]|uniref:hypothetical protein n=1 Tax=unclassified Microcoleus TaxID=2642155 RepID=UPI002FD771C8